MYFIIVIVFMFVAPIGSIYAEHLHNTAPLLALVGKWFVFWSVGVRLLLAGLRQYFQPSFTAKEIFHIEGDGVLLVVRELGIANFCAGVIGMLSLLHPAFTLPAALYAAIFYGIAGFRHIAEKNRSANENLAMISDLFVFVVLAGYVALFLGAAQSLGGQQQPANVTAKSGSLTYQGKGMNCADVDAAIARLTKGSKEHGRLPHCVQR